MPSYMDKWLADLDRHFAMRKKQCEKHIVFDPQENPWGPFETAAEAEQWAKHNFGEDADYDVWILHPPSDFSRT